MNAAVAASVCPALRAAVPWSRRTATIGVPASAVASAPRGTGRRRPTARTGTPPRRPAPPPSGRRRTSPVERLPSPRRAAVVEPQCGQPQREGADGGPVGRRGRQGGPEGLFRRGRPAEHLLHAGHLAGGGRVGRRRLLLQRGQGRREVAGLLGRAGAGRQYARPAGRRLGQFGRQPVDGPGLLQGGGDAVVPGPGGSWRRPSTVGRVGPRRRGPAWPAGPPRPRGRRERSPWTGGPEVWIGQG